MNIRFAFSRNFVLPAVAIIAVGALAIPVLANTPAEIIKLRQDTMKKMAGHMKAIKAFAIDGQGSADDVAKRAAEISEIAGKIPSLFPEGTGMDEIKDPKTGAKPEIWLDWEKFQKDANGLQAEGQALEQVAQDGDRAAITAAFQSVGENGCGTCHKAFRQKIKK